MYTNRIVAFIDLLGFSDLVLKKETTYESVHELIKDFNKHVKDYDGHFIQNLRFMEHAILKRDNPELAAQSGKKMIRFDENSINVTFASDSVIWSYEHENFKGEFVLLFINILNFLELIQR